MAKSEKLARSATSAVIWNTIFTPLKLVAELAANLIKANALSPTAFGLLEKVSALANTFGVWVDLGVDRALPKFIPEQERSGGPAAVARLLRTITRIKLVMLIGVSLLFLFYSRAYVAGLVEQVLALPGLDANERARLLSDLTRWSGLLVGSVLLLVALGAFYDMLMAYLISFFRHRAWNGIALATSLLGPLLVSLVVLLGWGVPGVLLAMIVTPVVAVTLAAWQVRIVQRSLAGPPSGADAGEAAADAQGATWRLLPQGFVAYTGVSHLLNLSDWATSLALAALIVPGLEQVALLAIGFKMVRIALAYLFTPLAGVQVPLFTRVRAGEGGTLDGTYQSITRLLLFLMLPGGVGLSFLALPLLAGLYPRYVGAAPLIWVLAPCLFLDSLLSTAQIALMVYERYRAVLLARLLAFVSVPLLLVLTAPSSPVGAAMGAAIALGLARVLARLLALYLGQRELRLGFPLAFAGRVGLASAVMALPLAVGVWLLGVLPAEVSAFELRRLLYLAAVGGLALLAALVFLLALRALGGLDKRDREQLLRMKLPGKGLIRRLL
jgi:O-antigen/teichoic acid export membrane protein